jgi:hypothetical protein
MNKSTRQTIVFLEIIIFLFPAIKGNELCFIVTSHPRHTFPTDRTIVCLVDLFMVNNPTPVFVYIFFGPVFKTFFYQSFFCLLFLFHIDTYDQNYRILT